MKARYFAIAAALIVAASLSSCTSDNLTPAQTQISKTSYPKVINVSVAGETRALLEGNKPVWETYSFGAYGPQGDQLYISSVNDEGEITNAFYSCTNPETGEFTLNEDWGGWMNGDPEGPYVVTWFTNTMAVTSDDLDMVKCSQPYNMLVPVPGALDCAYMVGKTDDLNSVTLKNIMALLKITIPEGSDIKYVDLTFKGWDSADYVISTDSWAYGLDNYAQIDSTTAYYGTLYYNDYAQEDPDSVPALLPGEYYFPVIPQTLAGSSQIPAFTLSYTDVSFPRSMGNSTPNLYRKFKYGAFTLEAGKIYDLGVISIE